MLRGSPVRPGGWQLWGACYVGVRRLHPSNGRLPPAKSLLPRESQPSFARSIASQSRHGDVCHKNVSMTREAFATSLSQRVQDLRRFKLS